MADKKVAKKSTKKVAKKAAKKEVAEGKKGRTSQFAGKKLYKTQKDNPRREGTAGHKSYSVITNGMSYEAYITAGGRRQDLAFDVAKGYTELR